MMFGRLRVVTVYAVIWQVDGTVIRIVVVIGVSNELKVPPRQFTDELP